MADAVSGGMRLIVVPAAGTKATVSKSPLLPGNCKVPASTAIVLPAALLKVNVGARVKVPVPVVLVNVPALL